MYTNQCDTSPSTNWTIKTYDHLNRLKKKNFWENSTPIYDKKNSPESEKESIST